MESLSKMPESPLFPIGEVRNGLLILEVFLGAFVRDNTYKVQCKTCGRVYELNHPALLSRKSRNLKACGGCGRANPPTPPKKQSPVTVWVNGHPWPKISDGTSWSRA